ncbi:lactonase family protein [Paenibacillus sp. HB172176]|uniref:lactonase family protein n=1 Tax=Paenibacillus sp. HB172176 TaxID=2493690 RepID=UPI001F0F6FDA|nr:lactonase family protein [Paenibacillus sp. HB172176]
MTATANNLLLFIGSYSEGEDEGIHICSFDGDREELARLSSISGVKNPTFLNVDENRKLLYAIGEGEDAEGKKAGEAVCFSFDSVSGGLTELGRKQTVHATTCHIQRDSSNAYLTVTSYHGGLVGLLALNPDGSIGEVLDVQQHAGSSVHPNQDRPHPHSSFYSRDGHYLFVQDLGLDLIVTYRIVDGKLVKHQETALPPGSGPRHLVVHGTLDMVYVINELNSTISALSFNSKTGLLALEQTESTLPRDYGGENGCAEIAISNDGRFLYGSNRGHDSIVVFAIDPLTGGMTTIQHISTEGGHPRHFALTPDGRHMLVANRDANNVVIFRVSPNQGTLSYSGKQAAFSKPVCVIPKKL